MAERIRSMAGGRIVWDDTEPLHRWIEAVKPSLVPAARVAWVQVHSRAAGTPAACRQLRGLALLLGFCGRRPGGDVAPPLRVRWGGGLGRLTVLLIFGHTSRVERAMGVAYRLVRRLTVSQCIHN